MAVYLTHGAKKNVGDYLIHSRARKLWNHLSPDTEIVSIPRWQKTELPDTARALVLCGGPGLATRMTENVFPVARKALEQGIPLAGLALGWHGMPAGDPGAFAMSGHTAELLHRLTASGPISVRDDLTSEVAGRFNIETIRTGCSAWYSIPHLGQLPASKHREPKTVVFTTPARGPNTREAIAVMRLLRRRFPQAKLIATFHRGIARDALTTAQQSRFLRLQAIAARTLGFEVRDVSYDLGKIGFYQETDLHIGYRVHAHLDFVSRRMPSILLSEDGRGIGQTASLHGQDQVLWAGSAGLVDRLDQRISEETANNWASLARAVETIESSLPTMKSVIQQQARL